MAGFRLKETVEQYHGIKILIDWRDTVWQIARLDGNNWDTMQKGLSDYSNNERQWQKIDGLNSWKGQRQQIAIPSAVHKLWFFVKFRSMTVYGCPIVEIVINTEYTILIFIWWKLIKNQHFWPADEIAISCHEWPFVVNMIWLKDKFVIAGMCWICRLTWNAWRNRDYNGKD